MIKALVAQRNSYINRCCSLSAIIANQDEQIRLKDGEIQALKVELALVRDPYPKPSGVHSIYGRGIASQPHIQPAKSQWREPNWTSPVP